MSQETELKLMLPAEQFESLKQHSFWEPIALNESQVDQLGNTYFDTADRQLNAHRVALRIRTMNGKYIQTLKTQSESVDGLTRRGEWEWVLPSHELDVSLLTPHLPVALQTLRQEQLAPLFTTNFQRNHRYIRWKEPSAVVEVAFDEGLIIALGRTAPICEVELELVEGDDAALAEIAKALKEFADISYADKSKAERGFSLLRLAKSSYLTFRCSSSD